MTVGAIKRALSELTDREQRALEVLHDVANGRYRHSEDETPEWLRECARRKARELEQRGYDRYLAAREDDAEYRRSLADPYRDGFGRYPT